MDLLGVTLLVSEIIYILNNKNLFNTLKSNNDFLCVPRTHNATTSGNTFQTASDTLLIITVMIAVIIGEKMRRVGVIGKEVHH